MATLDEIYLTDKLHKKDYAVTSTGDTALDSGLSNLTNALFRRLITSKGTIIHRPNYGVGIKNFQNKLNTLSAQRDLASRIDEQFSADPRVQSVDSVSVANNVMEPAKTTISVKVTPKGQGQITLKFQPFGG